MNIDSTFSSWKEINIGIEIQGLVLGSLLFNVFINDIFLLENRIQMFNFANDTAIYACGTDLNAIISNLESDGSVLAN